MMCVDLHSCVPASRKRSLIASDQFRPEPPTAKRSGSVSEPLPRLRQSLSFALISLPLLTPLSLHCNAVPTIQQQPAQPAQPARFDAPIHMNDWRSRPRPCVGGTYQLHLDVAAWAIRDDLSNMLRDLKPNTTLGIEDSRIKAQ